MKISKESLTSLIGITSISVASVFSSGCETTGSNTIGGAVLGTGLGAIIGNQYGHSGRGAAIGGAAGLLGGILLDQKNSNGERGYRQEKVLVPESYMQDRDGNWVKVPEHYEIREYRVR